MRFEVEVYQDDVGEKGDGHRVRRHGKGAPRRVAGPLMDALTPISKAGARSMDTAAGG
jgi:hypothetical protein